MREQIIKLRQNMRDHQVDVCLVFSSDPHTSEYVGNHFKVCQYLSGFTGSAGTLAVFMEAAVLFTDSRYFLQAEEELKGSGIKLMRTGEPGVLTLEEYLLDNIKEGATVGVDATTLPASVFLSLQKTLAGKRAAISYRIDLMKDIWTDRPPLPDQPAFFLNSRYAGEEVQEKLIRLRKAMRRHGCNLHLITTLDDICWLFNLRGGDIAYNPLVLSYALIGEEEASLFVDETKLNQDIRATFQTLNIAVYPYEAIESFLSKLKKCDNVLLSKDKVNFTLYSLAKQRAQYTDALNPTSIFKSIKNETEQANMRRAHIKDGVAMVKLLFWLKTCVNRETITEIDIMKKARALRQEQAGCIGESFPTIAGYGSHGAIVHYSADEKSNVRVYAEGLLLVDSGGQYYEGTTDITRTIALGPLTDEMKRHFTLVLKGMLALSCAKFPSGTYGYQLDTLARSPLWSEYLNYKHGTGHGIGYMLCVHEGPVGMHPTPEKNPIPLSPGMVLSNEPGLYLNDQYGIRLENQLLVMPEKANEHGSFLGFETLSLVPIDVAAIDAALLTSAERNMLNAYHERVYSVLAPLLCKEERAFLELETRPV